MMQQYPWEDTEKLLKELVAMKQETEKVDFKHHINPIQQGKTNKKQLKAEMLKDIASIANSYSSEHDNHGFIILGVEENSKEILGTNLKQEDISNYLNDITCDYLSPHPNINLQIFPCPNDESKQWGAIIIIPGIELPHVLIRDVDNGLNKGEVWVRKGCKKNLAGPEDYSRFFNIRTENIRQDIQELKVKINMLNKDIKNICEQRKTIESTDEKTIVVQKVNQKEAVKLLDLVKDRLPKKFPS